MPPRLEHATNIFRACLSLELFAIKLPAILNPTVKEVSKSRDWQALYCSETSIYGFWGSENVKGSVGKKITGGQQQWWLEESGILTVPSFFSYLLPPRWRQEREKIFSHNFSLIFPPASARWTNSPFRFLLVSRPSGGVKSAEATQVFFVYEGGFIWCADTNRRNYFRCYVLMYLLHAFQRVLFLPHFILVHQWLLLAQISNW